MKEYDIVVIGSGSGMNIIKKAVASKKTTALIDKGPAGGTCLNSGCIPSKMLIAAADRIQEIKESKKFGIDSIVGNVDFKKIMEDMRKETVPVHKNILKSLRTSKGFDFYEGRAEFIEDYILKINDKKIMGKKIFIACGARPMILKGFEKIDFLTNESVLRLKERPESLIILGGGFVAVEYAHFFAAIGTKVTVVQRNKRLVPDEEPEISEILQRAMEKRMRILTNVEIRGLRQTSDGCLLHGEQKTGMGKTNIKCRGKRILMAVGRISNADILKVDRSGIRTDNRGFIMVDEYLETSKKGIWAFGDAIGKAMFTHSANKEARYAWHNAVIDKKSAFDFRKVPHAVYSWPQIASVGMTEAEARKKGGVSVKKISYNEVAKGAALREDRGIVKIVVKKEEILGCHIIGPYAPILIQEVVNAESTKPIIEGMHIHPSMTEIIQKATAGAKK